MILCRYTSCERAIEILKDQRLYASNPMDFNDPFEFWPGVVGEPDRQEMQRYWDEDLRPRLSPEQQQGLPNIMTDEVWKRLQNTYKPGLQKEVEESRIKASKLLRVLCFCDPNRIRTGGDDVLLWSHYAKKHKGVKIFFETDYIQTVSDNLFPVCYSSERTCVDITNPNDDNVEEKYRAVIITKNKSWEYEQEVRWIISKQECINDNGCTYIPLLANAIQRIDLGCRCEGERAVLAAIEENKSYQHVKLYKAFVHEHSFSLTYDKYE